MRVTLMDAEAVVADGGRRIIVPAGTEVSIGEGWYVTVTNDGLTCDCGRGVLCQRNPRTRTGR